MSHAVVRAHLEAGHGESLLLILKNKLKYGIFPDNYAIILMLDHFMTAKNYRDATKVAVDCMLQEEYTTPIVSQACLLATFRYALTKTSSTLWLGAGPGGESMAGLEVNSSSKLETSSGLLRCGRNGGWVVLLRTSSHITPLKNLCSFRALASLSPNPRRFSTCRLSNFFSMSFAFGV